LGRPHGRPFFHHAFDAISRHIFRESARNLSFTEPNVAGLDERRQKLGKIEAARHKVRAVVGTKARQGIGFGQMAGGSRVVSRFSGAFVRALLVMALIATPSVLLPDVGTDGKQMVALVALFAGILTFVEYNATYPGLVEFRDAAPFNRVRYLMLLATVFLASLLERGQVFPSTLTDLVTAVGTLIGLSMDFPYSPVRLITITMADGTTAQQAALIRSVAGIAYLSSLISLSVFTVLLKAGSWPSRGEAFNVWVNLPTFDPTAGGDVVDRLLRDARVNVALGFLLPFLIPAVVKIGFTDVAYMPMSSPQTLVWTMTAWAFLPASLFMRGIALGRLAEMIRQKRLDNGDGGRGLVPA
jgi:hypothetical protein